MKTTTQRGRATISALAGFTMVASMAAAPAVALAGEPAADEPVAAGGTEAATNGTAVESAQVTPAQVEGEFSFDQTTITSNEVIKTFFQRVSQAICGATVPLVADNPLGWKLSVSGDVETAFTASVGDLANEESTSNVMTCTCGGNPAGGRAIVTADVTGIPVEHLLAKAGAAPGANAVTFVRAVRQVCDVAEDAPVAMRSSIANVSGATMPFFRRAGVTRFDFEMLSLNPVDFVRLNRVDNLNDLPIICDHFLHSYANDTLGLVLAFGHDASEGGDGALNVRRTALAAARSHATHAELVRVADELAAGCDEVARQLDEMRGALTEHGFMEYLPLRFARAGKEDRFAQMAAAGVPQIGFGLGAITRIDGAESVNTRDLARYCAAEGDFAKITEEVRKTR